LEIKSTDNNTVVENKPNRKGMVSYSKRVSGRMVKISFIMSILHRIKKRKIAIHRSFVEKYW